MRTTTSLCPAWDRCSHRHGPGGLSSLVYCISSAGHFRLDTRFIDQRSVLLSLMRSFRHFCMMDIGGSFYSCFSSFETQRAQNGWRLDLLFLISKLSGV